MILFTAASAQAQSSSAETPQKKPMVAGRAGDQISKTELVLLGRKYFDLWGTESRRKSREKMFQSDDFGLWYFSLNIRRRNLRLHFESERNLLRLAKEFREGDKVSGKLMGLFMYLSGADMLKKKVQTDQPDPDALALLFASYCQKWCFDTWIKRRPDRPLLPQHRL